MALIVKVEFFVLKNDTVTSRHTVLQKIEIYMYFENLVMPTQKAALMDLRHCVAAETDPSCRQNTAFHHRPQLF